VGLTPGVFVLTALVQLIIFFIPLQAKRQIDADPDNFEPSK
jgi:hypothetical protein